MARPGSHSSKKPSAIRLRVRDRLGVKEISKRTGVPMSTLHHWLREHPLTAEESREIRSKAPRYVAPKKKLTAPADGGLSFSATAGLAPSSLGLAGESAVKFFLAQRGLILAHPAGDGDVVDIYVRRPSGAKVAFLQARVASDPPSRNGLPTISMRRYRKGQSNTFKRGDFHFLVGFCRENGHCYVYSYDEVEKNRNSVSLRDEACNAFDKIESWLDAA